VSKKDNARAWVNGYSITGAGIVIAAVIPGTSSLALVAIEATMAFHIGQIYKKDFTQADGVEVATKVGIAIVAGNIASLEALNFLPIMGWVAKAPLAAAIIKILGEAIIAYFEKESHSS